MEEGGRAPVEEEATGLDCAEIRHSRRRSTSARRVTMAKWKSRRSVVVSQSTAEGTKSFMEKGMNPTESKSNWR
jgi:hypothetical protein